MWVFFIFIALEKLKIVEFSGQSSDLFIKFWGELLFRDWWKNSTWPHANMISEVCRICFEKVYSLNSKLKKLQCIVGLLLQVQALGTRIKVDSHKTYIDNFPYHVWAWETQNNLDAFLAYFLPRQHARCQHDAILTYLWPLLREAAFIFSLGYLWTFEELVSKTAYIHSYMLLICSSGHSKEANFQHKIYCKWKMSILIEILTRRYQNIQILQL